MKNLKELFLTTDRPIFLDGAMGTKLMSKGLKMGELPELFPLREINGEKGSDILKEIHLQYLEAGSDIIYANTFGANRPKVEKIGMTVDEVVGMNIAIAKLAVKEYCEKHPGVEKYVALDIGPIGKLLEPMGNLSFEEAYDIYKEIVLAGVKAGADLAVIETMMDLYEAKAALLAVKENSDLPLLVTMSFEENGKSFVGTEAGCFATVISSMGADALGINCSLGPEKMVSILDTIALHSTVPLICKPNAGLPDALTGKYNLSPEAFARSMQEMVEHGAVILGGCCGTDENYIKALVDAVKNVPIKPFDKSKSGLDGICSFNTFVSLDKVRVIGERINPTGKKRLKEALLNGDIDYILDLAIEEERASADILDINVGLPGIDEVDMMSRVVKAVQSVCSLPLQIDSSNPLAIEAGLRAANGRCIINSVDGEEEKMKQIFPLAVKYGAYVVGLALNKKGIPKSTEERLEIASKIINKAKEYGISEERILVDALTLTVSAEQSQAKETLKAVEILTKRNIKTVLGVSNISFGLPERTNITRAFLLMALEAGLTLPIINPNNDDIMDAVVSYRVISGDDVSCEKYIDRFTNLRPKQEAAANTVNAVNTVNTVHTVNTVNTGTKNTLEEKSDTVNKTADGKSNTANNTFDGNSNNLNSVSKTEELLSKEDTIEGKLLKSVLEGRQSQTASFTKELLEVKNPLEVIDENLIPALDEVGMRYENGKFFLPQLLNAANAASAGFEVIKDYISKTNSNSVSKGTVLLATVEGDIHDIGKNIVKTVLENYGFKVVDLGRDVPSEKVVETAIKENIYLIGLSALMTTTVASMEKTIKALRESGHDCKIMVGGAVLTEDYAMRIGADFYSKDAKQSADIAKKVFAERNSCNK
ncbi:MAG: homocysteine S-methyltransferase family protein [Lachnospiraceae bacterium]|nr:homocysteine S-methyltransferase family protein [Lachnospiraceae bacterium]